MANVFGILTLVVATLTLATDASVPSYQSELKQFLLKDYDKDVNPDSQVTVGITMYLLDILAEKQDISFVTLTAMYWVDPRLTWNPEDFNNTDRIRLSSDLVWNPDISSYKGPSRVQTRLLTTHANYNAVVYANGSVVFAPPIEYQARCLKAEHNVATHNCYVSLGSWASDKAVIDVRPFPGPGVVVDLFSSHKFEVVEATAVREEIIILCCPEEVYPDVKFSVVFQKKKH